MKKLIYTLCGLLLLTGPLDSQNTFSQEGQDKVVKLEVGDEAPDWTLTGSDGKQYQLSDFKNKKAVVVAWYPMALTGG